MNPTARKVNESMSPLKWSLQSLPWMDRIIMIPTATKYKASSLMNRGINALSSHNRANFEAIKAAGV
eukprot:CAMPEP_0183735884 /NCGR_PEP_ID=MMETSP0737-20130205/47858_1 /TAXON_ID=385413 /ORGANISM="Thalassiosira miniscula, Strain CCMP1093" /LENGTH=66 /DNA_ID=CAMNT_0025969745 /DNA_START=66 /DNA_END=262 /DNA_ORIENTATION=-